MFTFRKAVVIAFALVSAWSPISVLGKTSTKRGIVAEVVWVDRANDKNSIFFAEFDGQNWKKVNAPLYSSKNPLSTPALGTKADGQKLLIWTEQQGNRAVLMKKDGSRQRSSETGNSAKRVWSAATIFFEQRLENYAANIVADSNQRFWVFWSSSDLNQSDIFMLREDENGWRNIEQINTPNKVPNYHAVANIDLDGNIYVQWTTYDLKAGQYVKDELSLSTDGRKLDSATSKQAESLRIHHSVEQNLNNIIAPDFLPENSRIQIHFPGNKLVQSVIR